VLTHLINHTIFLADVVNNPAPVDPTGGSNGINLLLSYAKWGAIITCALVGVVSGGMIAFGATSNRPDVQDKGKKGLLGAVFGVIVVAIAIPLVNTVFGAAS
jgi:hypothetical protein